jgi:hypothetical protein
MLSSAKLSTGTTLTVASGVKGVLNSLHAIAGREGLRTFHPDRLRSPTAIERFVKWAEFPFAKMDH